MLCQRFSSTAHKLQNTGFSVAPIIIMPDYIIVAGENRIYTRQISTMHIHPEAELAPGDNRGTSGDG